MQQMEAEFKSANEITDIHKKKKHRETGTETGRETYMNRQADRQKDKQDRKYLIKQ